MVLAKSTAACFLFITDALKLIGHEILIIVSITVCVNYRDVHIHSCRCVPDRLSQTLDTVCPISSFCVWNSVSSLPSAVNGLLLDYIGMLISIHIHQHKLHEHVIHMCTLCTVQLVLELIMWSFNYIIWVAIIIMYLTQKHLATECGS